MHTIKEEKVLNASQTAVWEAISDHCGMHRWLVPGMKVRLDPEGHPSPNGEGAVRVIERFGYSGRERVVEFQPPRRMTYTLESGFPIDDHLGEIVLEPCDEGTRLTWRVRFAPRYWGTGWLISGVVRHVLRGGLRRLPRLL